MSYTIGLTPMRPGGSQMKRYLSLLTYLSHMDYGRLPGAAGVLSSDESPTSRNGSGETKRPLGVSRQRDQASRTHAPTAERKGRTSTSSHTPDVT
jgi:hypothetical protein